MGASDLGSRSVASLDRSATQKTLRQVLALYTRSKAGQQSASSSVSGPIPTEHAYSQRRSIRATLMDREALRALPKGSLGRTYVEFMDAEKISLEALAAEIAAPVREVFGDMDEERQLVHDRITDIHDLWHVATGYSRDMAGEFALLAFGYEQLGNPAYRLSLAVMRPVFAFQAPDLLVLIDDARRRGREASWLPVQDWEGLLPIQLDEVRERLGLGQAPAYARYFRVGAWLRRESSLGAG